MRFVFECDSSSESNPRATPVQRALLSPVDGTPLSLLMKPLEEPSAAGRQRRQRRRFFDPQLTVHCWSVPASADVGCWRHSYSSWRAGAYVARHCGRL